jgi:hypothetical protein
MADTTIINNEGTIIIRQDDQEVQIPAEYLIRVLEDHYPSGINSENLSFDKI